MEAATLVAVDDFVPPVSPEEKNACDSGEGARTGTPGSCHPGAEDYWNRWK